jgi:formylglycine-generating enzyme required for sulfatase activity
MVLLAWGVLWIAAGGHCQDAKPWEQPGAKAGDEITGPDGGQMVWVPAGQFMMGSGDDDKDAHPDERPAHLVQITKGFWLGKCTVTLGRWKTYCQNQGSPVGRATGPTDSHPVTCVGWDDVMAYCDHYGLSLPTEAQWEYAARGPGGRKYPWGDAWDEHKCCNDANRGPTGTTFPVGSFPQGASWCGALDMAGNVWQWCQDWYDATYYQTLPVTDPPGPEAGAVSGLASTEPRRVLRGGAYALPAAVCRSASRIRDKPANGDSDYGFRVLMAP